MVKENVSSVVSIDNFNINAENFLGDSKNWKADVLLAFLILEEVIIYLR